MKTDLFQSCGHCWVFQSCWHIKCSTFTASSFRFWNSSTGIPSPPLALFIVMLSKAHLTSHSKMSGLVITFLPRSKCLLIRKVQLGNSGRIPQCFSDSSWDTQVLTPSYCVVEIDNVKIQRNSKNKFWEDRQWAYYQSMNATFLVLKRALRTTKQYHATRHLFLCCAQSLRHSLGDLPNPGTQGLLHLLHWQMDSPPLTPPGEPMYFSSIFNQ